MKQECRNCGGDCDLPGPPLCETCLYTRRNLNTIMEELDKQQRNPDDIVTNKDD